MSRTRSRDLLVALATILIGASAAGSEKLSLTMRSRVRDPGAERYVVEEKKVDWDAKKTAIIICDMWNAHWCKGATRRVVEMAPTMNLVVERARARGVLIVHAPSGTLKTYEDTPQRKLARDAPPAKNLPPRIDAWCRLIPEKEGDLPIDDSDGGCDCQPRCPGGNPWVRQIDTLEIRDGDAISDSGREIWSLFEQRGIENVILMGVHTNMCVLGRSFGLRNMVRFGKNVVLMRDLTDTMYNSRMRPFVSHFRGTVLVVEHIEKNWCPTVTSSDFTGEAAFRFERDTAPHVVIVVAEKLYETRRTLPRFAAEVLHKEGFRTTFLEADPRDRESIPGIEALASADLLLLSVRRRALPEKQLAAIRAYLQSGRPLVALRTSSHAFHTRGKKAPGHAEWQEFDAEVLGGNYHGHHPSGPATTVRAAPGAGRHSILRGIELPFESAASLYKPSPLAPSVRPLLIGSIDGEPAEPVAWSNRYGDARVFYTSLGHPTDFEKPGFRRLLSQAIRWALEKEPAAPSGS